MIADARQYVYQSPWNLLLPAVAIFLTVTSFNLLGDGLRRALDVRLAESGTLTVLTLQAKDLEVGAQIDNQVVPAIRGLSFDLAPGEVLGLVGKSGAGKSMIGRAIAKLLPPHFEITAGSLLFEGENLVQMPPARRRALLGRAIAFIPQQPMTALNPVTTIGTQFDEHLARLGEDDRKCRRDRAIAALAAARLQRPADLLSQYPHQLSGGMCQRVLIALAFSVTRG